MTATMSAQARLDQLNAEEAEDKANAHAKAVEKAHLSALIQLDKLITTCTQMRDEIEQTHYTAAHTYYDGSKNGLFWGPVTEIQKAMGKLK
jgi:hypothetical protein